MALASVGSLGTAAEGASSDSVLTLTTAATLEAGNVGVLTVVTDNAGASGNTNHHTSVTDSGSNTYSKVYEYTYSPGSAGGDGVTVSVWVVRPASDLSSGATLTINQSANTAEKCASFWEFTAGAALQLTTGSVQTSGSLVNHPPALTISGLSNIERLYFYAMGKEANTTTVLTPGTNYTTIDGQRSRNNSAAVNVRGQFRILTGTGDTSAGTMNVICDTAAIFLALEETTGGGTDALSVAGITTGAPTVDAPAIGQVHALTGATMATGAPTVDAPAIGQVHALSGSSITTGAPTFDAPTLTQIHNFAGSGITTSAPVLGAPAIGQVHALTASAITTAAPVMGAPSMSGETELVADGITTAAPVLGTPSIGQVHGLLAAEILAGSPLFGAPGIGQVHVLIASGITSSAPVLDAPGLFGPQSDVPAIRTGYVYAERRSGVVVGDRVGVVAADGRGR